MFATAATTYAASHRFLKNLSCTIPTRVYLPLIGLVQLNTSAAAYLAVPILLAFTGNLMDSSSYTYIASAYSHADPVVREERYLFTLHAAAYLMRRGEVVFSPIIHGHVVAELHDLPEEWSFWKHQDETLLTRCSKLYVLIFDGWLTSVGVKEEIELAKQLGLPIELMLRDEEDYRFSTHSVGRNANRMQNDANLYTGRTVKSDGVHRG